MRFGANKFSAIAGILLPIGLICLFAFCSLALALLGGRAYKDIQSSVDENFETAVTANYLRTKVSQNNVDGHVEMRKEGGFELLVITSGTADNLLETRIYVIDGELRETYVTASAPFEAASGITIATVGDCKMTVEDGLFQADILSTEGVSTQVAVALAGAGVSGGGNG